MSDLVPVERPDTLPSVAWRNRATVSLLQHLNYGLHRREDVHESLRRIHDWPYIVEGVL